MGPALLRNEIVQKGFVCKIFNGCAGKAKKTQLPDELSYLAPHLGREGFFKHYYRFGPLPEKLALEVVAWKPDIVLVSLFAYCYANEALETVSALRKAGFDSMIILGGAGVSANPEYFIRRSSANYAFAGESDGMIKNILLYPNRVAGMWYFEKERIAQGISICANNFQPSIAYLKESAGVHYYSAMFTRGCPMKCGFCSSRLHMPKFRKTPIDAIKELFQKTAWRDLSHLNIEDDAIVWDFEYMLEILYLFKNCAGSASTFSLENGIDYRALNKEKIKVLANLGLSKLNIALVSIDNTILKRYNRSGSIENFMEVVESAHLHKISITAYLIAGLKGDSFNIVRRGLEFLSTLPVLIGISPFYPVPGIQDFKDLSLFDAIHPRLCAGSSFFAWHDMSTEELIEIFCESRNINLDRRNRQIK